jgi:hypothetical protein
LIESHSIEGYTMSALRFGKLQSWHITRGFGIIQGPTRHTERYFLHISQLEEALDFIPEAGMSFSFEVAPPRKDGELPRAINAKAVTSPVVTEVL